MFVVASGVRARSRPTARLPAGRAAGGDVAPHGGPGRRRRVALERDRRPDRERGPRGGGEPRGSSPGADAAGAGDAALERAQIATARRRGDGERALAALRAAGASPAAALTP